MSELASTLPGRAQPPLWPTSKLLRPGRHPIAVALLTTLIIAAFGWLQNQGRLVGGAISTPKVLWLNYAVLTFVVLPLLIATCKQFRRDVRILFGAVFLSFAARGFVELYLLYVVRGWQCAYGIAHDVLTIGLILACRGRMSRPPPGCNATAIQFATLVACSLGVEIWMAWKFSTLASPADGIYFAAQHPRFRVVNVASWAAVAVGYPLLGIFLWRTRRCFLDHETKTSLQPISARG